MISSQSFAQNPIVCRRRHSLLKIASAYVVAALILLASCWFFRAPLLTGIANAWIVNDPLSHADAIVVLGGGVQTRPFEAARLYHGGYAPKILIDSPLLRPTDEIGLTPRDTDVTKQILLKQGIPEAAIWEFGKNVSSTYEEAIALHDWVRQNGAKKLLVIGDLFQTRRARWLFRKQLEKNGVQVIIRSAPPLEYNATNWWRHEEGLIAFQNELIKYALYRVKY